MRYLNDWNSKILHFQKPLINIFWISLKDIFKNLFGLLWIKILQTIVIVFSKDKNCFFLNVIYTAKSSCNVDFKWSFFKIPYNFSIPPLFKMHEYVIVNFSYCIYRQLQYNCRINNKNNIKRNQIYDCKQAVDRIFTFWVIACHVP